MYDFARVSDEVSSSLDTIEFGCPVYQVRNYKRRGKKFAEGVPRKGRV